MDVLAADLSDQDIVRQVTRGAKVVYQTTQTAYTQWPQLFPKLQRSIIDGLAGGGAKLVLADNLYL